jgi:hypothetical protein
VLDRIEKLERQNRRLFALTAALAMGLVLIVAWRLLPSEANMEARRFTLRGADGTNRGAFEIAVDGNPQVRLNDATGRARAMLLVRREGDIVLRMTGREGQDRMQLWVNSLGTPILQMADASGRTRIGLGLSNAGNASLTLRDPALREVAHLP